MSNSIFTKNIPGVGWVSNVEFSEWASEPTIECRAAAYNNEKPSAKQLSAYCDWVSSRSEIFQKSILELRKYLLSNLRSYGYECIDQAISEMTPIEIVFFNNGNYAFLFDCKWSEMGLAILIRDNDIVVGPQFIITKKSINY